jgi:hypothetical protein
MLQLAAFEMRQAIELSQGQLAVAIPDFRYRAVVHHPVCGDYLLIREI